LRRTVELLESGRDILATPNFERDYLKTVRLGHGRDRVHLLYGLGESHIGHDTEPAQRRDDFAQQFETLADRVEKHICIYTSVVCRTAIGLTFELLPRSWRFCQKLSRLAGAPL
jgi:hypothetical protein